MSTKALVTPQVEIEQSSQILTQQSLITWATQGVQPPGATYIGVNDALQIIIWSRLNQDQIQVRARVLRPDGTIFVFEQITITPVASHAAQVQQFQLAEGFLLDVAAASVQPGNGPMSSFVAVNLVRNQPVFGNIVQGLLSDYVGQRKCATWPNGKFGSPFDTEGMLDVRGQGNPAAGADFTIIPSTGLRWKVLSICAFLTTSVTAATRQVNMNVNRAGTIVYVWNSAATQVASLGVNYCWAATPAQNATNGGVNLPIPLNLYITHADQVQIVTSGLQVGDQWSGISYLIQEQIDQTV